MNEQRPVVGITMGDPAGVGPEIIAMTLAREDILSLCRPLVIGDAGTIRAALRIVGLPHEVVPVEHVHEVGPHAGCIAVLDMKNVDLQRLTRGTVAPSAGRAAYESLRKAIDLALAREIQAVVTAPLNKEALNAAGYRYAGHTEVLAEACGGCEVTMMLVSGLLRVSHVSTHVSLRHALDRVRKERILRVIQLTDEALRDLGVREPSIAVAGLNPHASDGGLFGHEEAAEIEPAVRAAVSMGLRVQGPLPADSVFYRALRGHKIGQIAFDAVVAMYHDQGHIPIKLLGMFDGVNVTLGLPIIRTSVDHGTAFDKAGKGTAKPDSLIEAVKLAVQMVCIRDAAL